MAKIKSRPMDSYIRVVTSRALNKDQTIVITRHFFFTHKVTKSKHFIFDQTDET